MRTLLHAPRTRKRSIAAATLGALALVGTLLVATPAQAVETGTGGVFVPGSGRVLDTKVGTGGFSTPMEAGKYRTIKIAGVAGIPNDGTVGAVSLNATVSGSPDNGILYGRPDADTSRTTMLIYNDNAGEYVSNTAIVAVSAAGTIQVSTETAARLILDVQGYYTANTDGTAAGGFVPVAGKRIVDTRSGLGAPKALLAPGKSVDIQVTGANGVPAGASGAVVNLLPINSTASDGYLTPYATGTTRPDNALHYAPSVNTSIQAQVRLSSSGKMTIYNGSSTINLVVDLQGYFTKAGVTGATFTPGAGRVYDSRATGNTALAKNESRSIQIAGVSGVPVMGSGVTAAVITLTVAHGGGDGRATVWADGTERPDTTSINFRDGEIRTNTVTVPLGTNGKIALANIANVTNYVVDVQGWYRIPNDTSEAIDNFVAGLRASNDADSAATLEQFRQLTAGEQQQFAMIITSSTYLEESNVIDAGGDGTVASAAYPDAVTYTSTSEFTEEVDPDGDPVEQGSSGTMAQSAKATKAKYKANATVNEKASAEAKVFKVTVTKLTQYITFKTNKNRVISKVVGNSVGIRNYNFAIKMSYQLDSPYMDGTVAVTSCTWFGDVAFKDSGVRFSKRHVAQFGYSGLFSNKMWNV